jgi:hypothetical protein
MPYPHAEPTVIFVTERFIAVRYRSNHSHTTSTHGKVLTMMHAVPWILELPMILTDWNQSPQKLSLASPVPYYVVYRTIRSCEKKKRKNRWSGIEADEGMNNPTIAGLYR